SEGGLPFETLSEYLQKKNNNIERLSRIPNLGEKSISELIAVLDKYIEAPTVTNSPAFALPQQIDSITIPAPYKDISLVTFIRTSQCSVRLHNALTSAVERKEFGPERLGDLDGKSIGDLRTELRKV